MQIVEDSKEQVITAISIIRQNSDVSCLDQENQSKLECISRFCDILKKEIA
jgi:hypothetical protein